ncbi:hypothetical protein CEP54_012839 [Fusarium duplospermum]|uniref:Zn(2)-C6 fungal-type domain-containing protein n=1 Tax=Fusarium duplospermum TaxID=1325734 RepID=A0A428P6D7_9HYPO|nr:hypothetical protein CEP54_012839 [Fusarium duplospermum]
MAFPSPPSYEVVSHNGPREQLPTSELICLILDGRSIYPAGSPLPRYELSVPPYQATSPFFGIKKVKYRLSKNNGQGKLRLRMDDLYTCRDTPFRIHTRRHIAINGNTRDSRTYNHVKLRPGITSWSSCSVAGFFKAVRGRRGKGMIWKDDAGRIIAVEEEAMLMEGGWLMSTPSLRLLQVLSDRDLDLILRGATELPKLEWSKSGVDVEGELITCNHVIEEDAIQVSETILLQADPPSIYIVVRQVPGAMSPPPDPAPSPAPNQPPKTTPNTSASRQKLARWACDSCKVRKIRCSETPPCTGCAAAGIECTFNRLQATRGPRGLRAKTLDKIERRRRGKVDVKCADLHRENGSREQPTDEITCLVDVLDVYAERLFPIWPICDAADLRNKIKENPSRDDSARLLANAVALATLAQLKLETAWHPSVDKVETSGLNQTLDLLDSLRISFFLHIYHENASPGGTKSLVYLREAITQAQILRLDRESTYASLCEGDQHVSRRVLWLLFVTERGVALLHKLPIVLKPNILFPWFGGADDQAEVLPAFLKLVHLFWVFDQSGIFEILRNADTDSDIPNMASVAQSCLELLQQKLLDSVDNDDWGPVNQVQRADMFVTRQWMRAVLWRASLRFGIVIPGMNPIDIAKDFLSLVSELPKAALESHGPTLEFKTFEIATAVIDAMASNHSAIPIDQPGPILHRLRDILSSCRGGNRTLLSLLTMKMDAVSGSGLLLEAPNDDAIVFQMNTQPGFDTAELLANQSNISMPTYQFMEEQASQICWPPLDLGYLVRSPSPLTRMLLESMPRDVTEENQTLPA